MGSTVRDLRDFLLEAELEHYLSAFRNELKIASVPQIKYVAEEDLQSIGMTKPEMRRLKKFFKKECPQGKLEKFKRALLDRANLTVSPSTRTLSPSSDHRISRPISYIRPTGKQIISSDLIEVKRTLGEGEFGVVQEGVWTTEAGEKVEVALKCLSRDRMENGTQEFLKEAGLMQTIDHGHIVRMYGVVLDKENSLMLVTELAPLRSFLECLKDPTQRQHLTLARLCDFTQQISDGMAYLESKRLIHRDLAARNILMFSHTTVKISDFGLSRALGRGKDYYQSNFTINLKLPIAWCAPECINYLKFTSSSDVWAFGVTLWEMFTYGCQPWAGLNGQQILDAIDSPNFHRLDQPELCPRNYYELMQKCWDHDAENRPTFSEMYIMLPQMRPTQVKAIKDFPEVTVPKDYIYYKAYDVITVLDKTPVKPPVAGLWKGALASGKTGYFDPCNTVPFIEPKSSPDSTTPKKTIMRKDSKRSGSKKIRPDMISRPQNDLRHTGHIGYDGAIFGDVGFIGDNYDKLPFKTASIGRLDDSRNSINLSRLSDSPDRDRVQLSLSDSSLHAMPPSRSNGYGKSWISVESLESQSTGRTDEREEKDAYLDIDDDSLLADFKMPDLGSSLDFGGSFMDEVLKALNEKESQLESTNEKVSTGSQDDVFTIGTRNRSISPQGHAAPPPLPSQPPRAETKASITKPEPPRKQAKVKPMSTSDEKMMEEAISLATELDSHTSRAQMMGEDPFDVPDSSDRDGGTSSGSPSMLQKIRASIKREQKVERQRTFSDSLKQDSDNEIPPEAQEAYNMLVVHGSVKEGSRGYPPRVDSKRESLGSNNSGSGHSGHNFAYADSSNSSLSQTPDRSSPAKSLSTSRQSSEHGSPSPPVLPRQLSRGAVPTQTQRPSPVPRVEPPTPPKRGEPPVPKPRPEIQRVEPTFRATPPPVPAKDFDIRVDGASRVDGSSRSPLPIELSAKDSLFEVSAPIAILSAPLAVGEIETEWKRSEESLKSDRNSQAFSDSGKLDSLNTSIDSGGRKSTSPSEASQSSASKFSFFEEEISEPSPREIMSKLARESRLRRSLDHQRGVTGDVGETTPNRNLREPQGIPGKAPISPGTTGSGDEEVDTNPLRMLRGGVIPPVRGARVGSGMSSSSKPTLRHPKLHFSSANPGSPMLQHSLSMETGRDKPATPEMEPDESAPALPPRETNGEEIELLQKLFGSDVTKEDCREALQDTRWDIHKAVKLIKLKQLLSIQLGDVSRCKEALLACDWNIQGAADYLLNQESAARHHHRRQGSPPSPETVDV
ncbi:activated Cdc42 kinase-like isoform X2 [Dreissena polymorpha]|nr:activated Cdc42 kinase-like isoform X2 [Dreissena polymorpha]XP_052227747.1 activated Cdc42 kinase-like isoform X2 [Dreissena polymorpha]XP_052227748.1 activated Cdc42 kinase-like isoform X2 [Dreissena polymorpha]XP_052227749.1 activated Cdc42 kinase-like isoform X2 [Dreissena polymorpha]XP_052227750.1 activated Cdc42 kinase-like isoform X2 [Dreissena polymorpha]XP_052227751.1 activated Cdc42 kinase-like isoform X2 [Dreissena polymorpha]